MKNQKNKLNIRNAESITAENNLFKNKSKQTRAEKDFQKQLKKDIIAQGFFVEQTLITHLLMTIYDERSEDFKLIIGTEFIKNWARNPYENTELFWDFCDELAQTITHYWIQDNNYPVLKSTGIFQYIGLVKGKKKSSHPTVLIDYLEKIRAEGLNP